MKRTIIFILSSVLCLTASADTFQSYTPVQYGGSQRYGYTIIRTVEANDTQLTATTKTWDAILSDANFVSPASAGISYPCFSFFAHGKNGTDPAGGSFDVNCYAARAGGGVRRIWWGTVGIGTQQLSVNPETLIQFRSGLADPNYKWADEMTNFNSSYPVTPSKVDYDGSGGLLEIWMTGLGNEKYKIEITNATLGIIDKIYVVMSGAGAF